MTKLMVKLLCQQYSLAVGVECTAASSKGQSGVMRSV